MLLPGKLPTDFLKTCITHAGTEDPRVLIGPRFGEDCAVIDIGAQYLVVKTDPVTFTAADVGWYAVHINANDVATMGAQPAWFQTCLLFPPDTPEESVRQVFAQIDSTCRDLGITVTGGHTEVTASVTQPVVVGNMTGVVAKDRLVTTQGVRAGDLVVMTKTAGLEGTSIVFTEKHKELEDILPPELQREAQHIRDNVGNLHCQRSPVSRTIRCYSHARPHRRRRGHGPVRADRCQRPRHAARPRRHSHPALHPSHM